MYMYSRLKGPFHIWDFRLMTTEDNSVFPFHVARDINIHLFSFRGYWKPHKIRILVGYKPPMLKDGLQWVQNNDLYVVVHKRITSCQGFEVYKELIPAIL